MDYPKLVLALMLASCNDRRAPSPAETSAPPLATTFAPATPPPPPPKPVLWRGRAEGKSPDRESDEVPVLLDVNGDGVEDIVGRLGEPDPFAMERVGVIDGKTFSPLWLSAPLNRIELRGTPNRIVVHAGRVVVVDPKNRAHVFDLVSGRETAVLDLDAAAPRICSTSPAPAVVLDLADGRHVRIDLATGALRATEEACGPRILSRKEEWDCRYPRPSRGKSKDCPKQVAAPDMGPAPSGFARIRSVRSGDVAASLGISSGRARVVTLSDVAKGQVRWEHVIGDDEALREPWAQDAFAVAGRHVYFEYRLLKDNGYYREPAARHLAALDVETGARAWDLEMPAPLDGTMTSQLVVSPTRLYLARAARLDVFERSTGQRLGTVGWR